MSGTRPTHERHLSQITAQTLARGPFAFNVAFDTSSATQLDGQTTAYTLTSSTVSLPTGLNLNHLTFCNQLTYNATNNWVQLRRASDGFVYVQAFWTGSATWTPGQAFAVTPRTDLGGVAPFPQFYTGTTFFGLTNPVLTGFASPVPAPGALALIGLTGLAPRRRRA